MATAVLASIGDQGVLNATLSEEQSAIWLDRDLSWLDFNERVLAEALDERTPLLERAKFLAIFTSNLDEFVMKRVAILCQAQGAEQQALFNELREKLLPMLAQTGGVLPRDDHSRSGRQRRLSPPLGRSHT